MVTSMTGFGKGYTRIGEGGVSVEIRTVNHRFIDFSVRMPRLVSGFDKDVEKMIRRKIKRGHVYVTVTFDKDFEIENFGINKEFLRKTYSELAAFIRKEGIPGEIDINRILALPEAFSNRAEKIPVKKLQTAVGKAVTEALDNCARMRTDEGTALAKDVQKRLGVIGQITRQIERKAPLALKKALARNRKRIKLLLPDGEIENDRWAVEAALMADRTDFSEELVRLLSHLDQFGKVVKKGGEVSKKLTFLLQEIHREATTMGNKSTDPGIIRDCLLIKEQVEKIREQIQNLE